MKKAAANALQLWGTGSGASRLISGNTTLYKDLEEEVALFKQTGSALVFSSGYAANVGLISSLVGPGDLILSDFLNHASIVDACRLSKARIQVYPHTDVDFLEDFMGKRDEDEKALVVTDGVFSMDGDLAPIPELYRICRKYGALLIVDDAHATGVIGEKAGGSLDYFNLENPDIVQVGTFSKALGSLGGFVVGSTSLVDFVLNRARSLIYSTALPPSVLAANLEGLRIIQADPSRRERLHDLISYLQNGLELLGFHVSPGPVPIFPLLLGSTEETVSLSQHLWDRGIFVPPIRPPTVPHDKSRLRISLSALHTKEDLDQLLMALDEWFKLGS
jgi:glycine C-acetyltransferase/8-amino-7-oxononanoate synthase